MLHRCVCVSLVMTLFVLSGCIPGFLTPLNNDEGTPPPAATPPSLEGFWMSSEISQVASEDEAEAQARVAVDYWKFTQVQGDATTTVYQVSAACTPDVIVGYATLYEEGTVLIDVASTATHLQAMLSEDDSLVGMRTQDEASWVAQRVEPPVCGEIDGVVTVIDPSEELVDPEPESTLQESLASAAGVPNGIAHLDAAKGRRLDMSTGPNGPTGQQTTNCSLNGGTVPCPAGTVGHAGYVECVDKGMNESKIQELADVACLLDTDKVYPGGLLQGAYFDGGSFTPITIPRAPGRITLGGLFLNGQASYSASVDSVSYASITDAIARLLTDNQVAGTAANATYRVDTVSSSNQWAFKLGTDVKFMSADISASANTENESKENTVIMKFNQVFYTVSFEDPVLRTSVFADGTAFDDPENQITGTNPPLYVSNVKYGRQVFFIAKSSLGSHFVEAALRGAYSGAASVTVTSGMSYKDIMSKTSITYIVRGGDAGLALAPIASATPDAMYDAVKGFLANRNAAVFSPANPGIPVAYTLRYLDDRTVAMKGLSTTYDQHDCRTIPAADYQYRIEASDIDDDLYVWLDYETDAMRKGYTNTSRYSADVTSWLPDNTDHTVIMKLGNGGCFGTRGQFRIYRDGALVDHVDYDPGGWRDCGWQVDYRFLVNKATGHFSVTKLWKAH